MHYTATIIATLALLIASITLLKPHSEQPLVFTPSVQPAATPATAPTTPKTTPTQLEAISVLTDTLNDNAVTPETLQETIQTALQQVEQQLIWQSNELKSLRAELNDLKQRVPPVTDAEREYAEMLRDLPPDFEKRLKTDPEYAANLQKELLNKVTNETLSAPVRLRSVQQLMMVAGSVGVIPELHNHSQVANAMIQLADTSQDEATRIKALEHLSFFAANDTRHSNRFIHLLENDNNLYVRTLAADAIASMMYSANISQEQRSNLIQTIGGMMNNAPEKTQTLLKDRFGSPEQLQQLEQDFNNESVRLP